MMNNWLKYFCNFCERQLVKDTVLSPECDCEEFLSLKEKWMKGLQEKESEALMVKAEIDKKYPQIYFGERLIVNKDGTHKLRLSARNYGDIDSLTVWIPLPSKETSDAEKETEDGFGLGWDFTENDASALHDLLGEYLERK